MKGDAAVRHTVQLLLGVALGCLSSCGDVVSPGSDSQFAPLRVARPPTPEEVRFLSACVRPDGLRETLATATDEEMRHHRQQLLNVLDAIIPDVPHGQHASLRIELGLLKHGILRDGMKIEDAISILGEPTHRMDGRVRWYHNPGNRWHVYPGIEARETDGILTQFHAAMM